MHRSDHGLDKGADKTAITNENATPEQLANQ